MTEAWFPAHAVLPPHTHDRAIFATMLRGSFRTRISRHALPCEPGFAWTEPCGEKHANYVGPDGAHVVVIQADIEQDEHFYPFRDVLDDIRLMRHPRIAAQAPLIAEEIRSPDRFSALNIEALVVTLLTHAARGNFADGNGNRPAGWLLQARDILHDCWRQPFTLAQIARSVGVHPAYLARCFRGYFGESVGSYVRKLRLNWAIAQLSSRNDPISRIAVEAGFSDQSHLTRECRKHVGITPATFRAHRRAQPDAPMRTTAA